MILTGVFLSLTISCKMVGLFTFFTVGTAVVIDLWNLLDIKKGLTVVRNRSILQLRSLLNPLARAGARHEDRKSVV